MDGKELVKAPLKNDCEGRGCQLVSGCSQVAEAAGAAALTFKKLVPTIAMTRVTSVSRDLASGSGSACAFIELIAAGRFDSRDNGRVGV